jgi:hypothetical protein
MAPGRPWVLPWDFQKGPELSASRHALLSMYCTDGMAKPHTGPSRLASDRVLWGEFWPGALEIQAAAGTVIEIEISTQLTI